METQHAALKLTRTTEFLEHPGESRRVVKHLFGCCSVFEQAEDSSLQHSKHLLPVLLTLQKHSRQP